MAGPETPKRMVDIVIPDGEGRVLLIRRASEPFQGRWALPGGFVDVGETVEDAAVHEAKEEIGLDVKLPRRVGDNCHPPKPS